MSLWFFQQYAGKNGVAHSPLKNQELHYSFLKYIIWVSTICFGLYLNCRTSLIPGESHPLSKDLSIPLVNQWPSLQNYNNQEDSKLYHRGSFPSPEPHISLTTGSQRTERKQNGKSWCTAEKDYTPSMLGLCGSMSSLPSCKSLPSLRSTECLVNISAEPSPALTPS